MTVIDNQVYVQKRYRDLIIDLMAYLIIDLIPNLIPDLIIDLIPNLIINLIIDHGHDCSSN